MESVLLINASPMGTDARGHALARQAVANLRRTHPDLQAVCRDLSEGGFGWVGPDYAQAIMRKASRNAPAFLNSERLIGELEKTDALIVSTPMHNYTVPATLKLWIDLVLRAGRSFGFRDGRKVGLLKDRPTVILVASGGAVTSGARQPDHLTAYLTDVLATIGIKDVRFIYLEGLAQAETAEASLAAGFCVLEQIPHFGLTGKTGAKVA